MRRRTRWRLLVRSMMPGLICVLSCIRARICTTGPRSNGFWPPSIITRGANILFDPSHFVLQQLDYLAFIDLYHDRIRAFHVKDAEFRPNGRSGLYGGYLDWLERPGQFRSLGDGQIDFHAVFSKLASTIFPVGRYSSGNAVSSILRTAPLRGGIHSRSHHSRDGPFL